VSLRAIVFLKPVSLLATGEGSPTMEKTSLTADTRGRKDLGLVGPTKFPVCANLIFGDESIDLTRLRRFASSSSLTNLET
jgi:hypothetical protein